MVYCTKCGTNNADDAKVCVNCGTPLYGTSEESRPYWRHRRYEGEYYGFHRRSGAIAGMVIGLIIILVGLSLLAEQLSGISIFQYWGPLFIILIGIFVISRWFRVRNRRR